jgi:hypothetical protein
MWVMNGISYVCCTAALYPYFCTDKDKDFVALVMAEIKKEKENKWEGKRNCHAPTLDAWTGTGHCLSLLY